MQTKNGILHWATTDMLLHLDVFQQFSVLQTDFKWFGPALPHTSVLTALRYFGVPEGWVAFIERFLQTPMSFVQDGPHASSQVRRRGAPMSHALSDVLGEALLFCLDYAVTEATGGHQLLRLHDDIWFWGTADSCATAWNTIQEFSKVTGLDLNEEKTGSVQMYCTKAGVAKLSSLQARRD